MFTFFEFVAGASTTEVDSPSSSWDSSPTFLAPRCLRLRFCNSCCFFRHSCCRNFLFEVCARWQKEQSVAFPQPCFLKR